ncbi:MAG: PAS domain S-box protein [Methylococcaceae bacterium]
MQSIIHFLDSKDLIPHGYCLSWRPPLLWLHAISDLLIAFAYYSIPLMLIYFIRRRKNSFYPWLVVMFAAFIIACGTTHLLSAVTIWIPLYWLDGWFKALTAAVSLTTAVLMLWVMPRALALPSTVQLQAEVQQRKAVEEALRKSRAELQDAQRIAHLGSWQLDLATGHVVWSEQLYRIFGLCPELPPPDYADYHSLFCAESWERLSVALALAQKSGVPYALELGIIKGDGTHGWIAARGEAIRDGNGIISGLHGIALDISERKQAEQTLHQLKAMIDLSLDGFWIVDLMGNLLQANEAYAKISGYSVNELVKMRISQLEALEGPEQIKAHIAKIATEGYDLFETKHRHKAGHYLDIEVSVAFLPEFQQFCVFCRDISERKRMEEKLRDSDAFNISILNSLTSHIAVLDAQGVIVTVNDAWRQFAKENGLLESGRAMLGANYMDDCKHGEEANAAKAGIAAVLKGESEIFHLEYACHSPTQQRWFHMKVSPLQGSRHGVVISHENITERKLMEEELKASEAKFRSIIDVSPVPMAMHDEWHKMTFLNPAFMQTFGYSPDDIPTVTDWRMKAFPDSDYRHWVEITWQAAVEKAKQEHHDIAPLEVVVRCKNDNIKTVLVTAASIHHDFAGECLMILYDITRLKQAETKLNAIFNASVEGIITTDIDGNIQSANAAVETIFGYKPEQLIGFSISKLMPVMHLEGMSATVKCIGQIQEIEGRHKNGSVLPLERSVAEFLIDGARCFTHIVRNVSLRKQREQIDKQHLDELAHVTRLGLMGEMASGIAHEVNQPLAAISSYAQVSLNLVNAENPDLVKLSEILYKTQQQALRAGRIIHRMREFVKSHAKHRSTADLNTLIHYAADLCVAELKQSNIKLIFELEHKLPSVYVDHVQIEQIILNLIRNSIDALQNVPEKQPRQLTVQSHLTAEKVIEVRVKDNGPGLDENQQRQILTPFYTTKSDGMGMGLSISRSLVEAHEGSLHFNSQPGKGSTFYFTLPIQGKN